MAIHVAAHVSSCSSSSAPLMELGQGHRANATRRSNDSCMASSSSSSQHLFPAAATTVPTFGAGRIRCTGGRTAGTLKGGFLSGKRLTWKISCTGGTRGHRGHNIQTQAALKDVPKQFREENLRDGLQKNFQTVPEFLYGLRPSQIDMFVPEDGPVQRKKVTEETITSAAAYREGGGMHSLFGVQDTSRLSMSAGMYRGGGGFGRPKTSPPDLPSLLLDARICYLGMPIVPAVTELIIAELLWLNYDNPTKPIYLYINSPGTQNDQRESIGFETEAYAIADTMNYVKPQIFTVNCGRAYGQAAMLLSLGEKGNRYGLPHSKVKIYAPKVMQSSGVAMDTWIKAKELHANTCYYVDLLALGTGKKHEDLYNEIQRPNYLWPEEAITYGIIDKVIQDRDVRMEKRNYDDMLAEQRAVRGPGRPGASPMVQRGGPSM